MEKFLGKYQSLPELTEGMDEFCKAMSIPDAAKETMKKPLSSETIQLEGGQYKEVNTYGDGREEVFVFKLGEPFNTVSMGMESKNVFKLEGNVMKGEHEVCGQLTLTAKYVEGDKVIFETTGNGVTMKMYFTKCS